MDASTNNIGYYSIAQNENEMYIQKKSVKNILSIGNSVNGKDYCKSNADLICEKFKLSGYYSKVKYDVPDIKSSFSKFLDEANYSSIFVDFVFYYSGEGSFGDDGKIYLKDPTNKLFPLTSIIEIFDDKILQLRSKYTKSYKLLIILDIFNDKNLKMDDKLDILVNLYENKQFSLNSIKKGCAVLCSPMIESYPVTVNSNINNNNMDNMNNINNNNNNNNIKILSFTKFLLERLNSNNSPGRIIIKTSKVLSEHIIDDFIEQTAYQLSTDSPELDLFDQLKFINQKDKLNINIKDITKILGSNYSTLFGDIFVSDFILIPIPIKK